MPNIDHLNLATTHAVGTTQCRKYHPMLWVPPMPPWVLGLLGTTLAVGTTHAVGTIATGTHAIG